VLDITHPHPRRKRSSASAQVKNQIGEDNSYHLRGKNQRRTMGTRAMAFNAGPKTQVNLKEMGQLTHRRISDQGRMQYERTFPNPPERQQVRRKIGCGLEEKTDEGLEEPFSARTREEDKGLVYERFMNEARTGSKRR